MQEKKSKKKKLDVKVFSCHLQRALSARTHQEINAEKIKSFRLSPQNDRNYRDKKPDFKGECLRN